MMGKVYFIAAPGRIKIGYTKYPERRLAQLQAIDLETLESLGAISGSRKLESRLHSLAAAHRLRGEWFSDCADVRELVASALRGDFADDEERPKYAREMDAASSAHAEVLRSATAETKRILAEVERGVANGEDVSDLVRSACFLGESVIAPLIGALDRARD